MKPSKKNKSAYQRAGVDIDQGDRFVASLTKILDHDFRVSPLRHRVHKTQSGYATVFKISPTHWIAATTDGVGTKLKLAFDSGVHDTVGIDLVAMSANDLICVGATPLFFLDYLATGKLEPGISEKIIQGIAKGCRETGMLLLGGETAEMPGFYKAQEYDLAGFAVGTLDASTVLDGRQVRPGDTLVGFASSGPHSNGYSLVRKILKTAKKKLPKNAYDQFQKACFEPTELYVGLIQKIRKAHPKAITGLAHITGSGFLNIPRIHEKMFYDLVLPNDQLPEVFAQLRKYGKLSKLECLTTFNCGLGLVASVRSNHVNDVLNVVKEQGKHAFVLGKIEKQNAKHTHKIQVRWAGDVLKLHY